MCIELPRFGSSYAQSHNQTEWPGRATAAKTNMEARPVGNPSAAAIMVKVGSYSPFLEFRHGGPAVERGHPNGCRLASILRFARLRSSRAFLQLLKPGTIHKYVMESWTLPSL